MAVRTRKSKGQFLRYGGVPSSGAGGRKIVRIPPHNLFIKLVRP